MKSSLSLTALGLAAVLIGYSLPANAGDGQDHGDAALRERRHRRRRKLVHDFSFPKAFDR